MSDDFDDDDNVIDFSSRGRGRKRPKKSFADQTSPGLHITVEGVGFDSMIEAAKVRAAKILRQQVEHIYVIQHGELRAHTVTRFLRPNRTSTWAMSVVLGIIPPEAREPEPEPPPPVKPKRRAPAKKAPAVKKPKQ